MGLESVPSGRDEKPHSALLPKPVEQNARAVLFFLKTQNKRLGLCYLLPTPYTQLKTLEKQGGKC